MAGCLTWIHFGDLHVDDADGYEGLTRFRALVALARAQLGGMVDFAVLPGDNANHGTGEQYAGIADAMTGLELPWHVLAGDHDFEPGDLTAMRAITTRMAPYAETIAGYRCLFLDIVSAGKGGPDFRIAPDQRTWIERELSTAAVAGEPVAVFMHAYPGDLRDDPDGIAGLFAAHRVAFVDTGHTHYNELLNDGRVVYGATRSIGQIEEGTAGTAHGFSIVTLDHGVPSWRFQAIDDPWPLVQITSPVDRRLITDPVRPDNVPGAAFDVRAKIFGTAPCARLQIDDFADIAMTRVAGVPGMWTATVHGIADGLHRLTVRSGAGEDGIDVLVRDAGPRPKRNPPVALGRDVNAVGAWSERGIDGAQRGPNKNGLDW
ncbi:metallophosphoesterase family protein [Sphingomonas faeni]|uniref:metallophosphoesterase family protein n=1 Tax=Sphingomonas faeni TaxID=185950 RepID=UPI00335E6FC5